MTDDLVNRLQIGWHDEDTPLWVSNAMSEAKDRIEVLTAQLESTLKDRKLILEERDRTFALMLARAEKAEAERDRAERMRDVAVQAATQFLVKLSDLEADNARLLKALTDAGTYIDKGQDKMAFNIIRAVLKAEAERDRLREALRHIVTYLAEPTVASEDTLNSLRGDLRFVGRVASAALKGESHD